RLRDGDGGRARSPGAPRGGLPALPEPGPRRERPARDPRRSRGRGLGRGLARGLRPALDQPLPGRRAGLPELGLSPRAEALRGAPALREPGEARDPRLSLPLPAPPP